MPALRLIGLFTALVRVGSDVEVNYLLPSGVWK
jgi:hypothetical protein